MCPFIDRSDNPVTIELTPPGQEHILSTIVANDGGLRRKRPRMKPLQRTESPWLLNIGAMAVHLYTASGTVLAFLIVLAAIQGDATLALWFGLLAMVIDGTDGMLARTFRVQERIPWIDGALLDNIVDYLTYVFAPIVLLWRGGYLPDGWPGLVLAAMPLLASAYQFSHVDAKTDDHFFFGFPSYWNVIAFYAFVTNATPATISTILVICAILVFVPIYYIYPSRALRFRKLTLAISGIWLICYALILLGMPAPSALIVNLSLLCVVYYFGISLYLTYLRNSNRLGIPRGDREDSL